MNNTNLKKPATNSLVAFPMLFSVILRQPIYQKNLIDKKYNVQIDTSFKQLPDQNIALEQNQMDILVSFVSKLVNESKDLDGEIVDMVNKNFKKLLLKI